MSSQGLRGEVLRCAQDVQPSYPIILSAAKDLSPVSRLPRQRQIGPAAFAEGDFDGVDDLLDDGAVVEVAVVLGRVGGQLVKEVLDQVGVEEGVPGFARVTAFGIEAGRYLELLEFDVVGCG